MSPFNEPMIEPRTATSVPQYSEVFQYDGTLESAKTIADWIEHRVGPKWAMGEDEETRDWLFYIYDEHGGKFRVHENDWVVFKEVEDGTYRMRRWTPERFAKSWNVS